MGDAVLKIAEDLPPNLSSTLSYQTLTLSEVSGFINKSNKQADPVYSNYGIQIPHKDRSQVMGGSRGENCPYHQLREAFDIRFELTFMEILQSGVMNGQIDLKYEYEDGKTVLDLARNISTLKDINDIFEELVIKLMREQDLQLIDAVLRVETPDPKLRTGNLSVEHAIKQKNIRTLCSMGDGITTIFKDGRSIIHLAEENASPTFMEHLLSNTPFCRYIDSKDVNGDTPLHHAAANKRFEMAACLLRHGANFTEMNTFGEPAFAAFSPAQIEGFLDECVTSGTGLNTYFKIKFDLDLLYGKNTEQNENEQNSPDTPALMYIKGRKDLRCLLKHPTLATLIQLKWQSVKLCFLLNLILYLLFLISLHVYVLKYNLPTSNRGSKESMTANKNSESKNIITKIDQISQHGVFKAINLFCLIILLIIHTIQEFLQFLIAVKYFREVENWFKILLLLITASIIVYDDNNVNLSAAAVFLSWIKLVFLVGRHPKCASSMKMLKTVSLNYIKCLRLYSLLIVGFVLAFYVLMRECLYTENYCFFSNVWLSFLKTIVMLTGDFDVHHVPFESNPVTNYVMFVLFVFLITIVLLNVLIGLAVSDTQKIINDAELLSYESQLNYVSHIENLFVYMDKKNKSLGIITSTSLNEWLGRKIVTFNNYVIYIYPNQSNSMTARPRRENSNEYEVITEDTFVERAREILMKRNNKEDALVIKEDLKEVVQQELKREMTELKEEIRVKIEELRRLVTQLTCNK